MSNPTWQDHYRGLMSPPSDRGLSRRRFVQGLLASSAAATTGAVGWPLSQASAAAADDTILVAIMFGGGNDGLSMAIPADRGAYQDARASLAIQPSRTFPIGERLFLHGNLPGLKGLYDQGSVAVLQGVGEAEDDHSHFSSMARWMSGHSSGMAPGFTGWLGRWLDETNPGDFGAVSIGDQGIPLHVRGAVTESVGLPSQGGVVGANPEPWEQIAYDALRNIGAQGTGRGGMSDAMGSAIAGALNVGQAVAPVYTEGLPEDGLVRDMTIAARMINLGLGSRVVSVGFGDFDTHDAHWYDHPRLMTELDQAITAFYATLSAPMAERVTIMTFSEFGRSFSANDSGGIDHGTASMSLVVGKRVRGGIYGELPSLTALDRHGDLEHTVDFRSVYASVINGWLGGDDQLILGGNYEDLGLFLGTGESAPDPNIAHPVTQIYASTLAEDDASDG